VIINTPGYAAIPLYLTFQLIYNLYFPDKVGPRHHGMARPQVAAGGTASKTEGSWEYIE